VGHTQPDAVISMMKIICNKWRQNKNTPFSLVSAVVQYSRCKQELTAKASFTQKDFRLGQPLQLPEPAAASSAMLYERKQSVLHCSSLDSLQPKTSLFRGDKLDYLILSAHTIRYLVL
jgi:hypothetical protein